MLELIKDMKQELKHELKAVKRRYKWKVFGYWAKLLTPIVLFFLLFAIVKQIKRKAVRRLKQRAKDKKAQKTAQD